MVGKLVDEWAAMMAGLKAALRAGSKAAWSAEWQTSLAEYGNSSLHNLRLLLIKHTDKIF